MSKPPAKKKASVEREKLLAASRKAQPAVDPLSTDNIKKTAVRIGIPTLIAWAIAIWAGNVWLYGLVGVLTVALLGVVIWAVRYAKRSKAVVEIMKSADTPEGRKAALDKLSTDFKKDDAAAVFAKAQLEMQDDPRKALATLEQINLSKVLASVADEARAQRAMIHLILGETDDAKSLVDPIDLGRHQDPKSRATLTSIVAEAWARSGQAKRAVDLLSKLDLNDEALADLKPQVLRAQAFAFAWASDSKQMRKTLHELRGMNVQYLMGFITKKRHPMGVNPRGVHPALEKEAFDIVMKSGAVQRRTEMRRG